MEFKGVNSPEVYIIDDKVHDEDLQSGLPLSGARGDFLFSLLGSMSLLDKTRMANWEGNGQDAVEEDILRCNPKVIIGLGSTLMNHFVSTSRKITDMSGEVVDIDIRGTTFKYLILMSPSYILNRPSDTDTAIRYSQDLYTAFKICNGEYVNILDEKEVLSAHTFDEFKEICDTRFVDDKRVAYDIETNARPIYVAGGKIIGFSIGNKTSGVYMSLHSLEHDIDETEEEDIWDYVKCEIFEKKRLIIHNTMYERPYTLYCKGYEIGFNQADDTLVMARLLKGSKEGAGLKYQAQKNLHYPDWETDLGTYISGFRGFIGRIGLGPAKFLGLRQAIRDSGNLFDVNTLKEYMDLKSEDQDEVMKYVNQLRDPMIDLYSEDEIHDLGKLITDRLYETIDQGGILDSTIPYNYVPDRVLCKYGAIDSISTYDLCEYFEKVMDTDSTDKVDLHKGYENWLEHMYVAYIMERNGMYWDEDLVKQDEEFLINQATSSLKLMLRSPLFKPYVNEACEWKYKPAILSDYLPDIATSQGYEVIYDKTTGKYIVKYQGKRAAKSVIDLITILDGYKYQYSDLVYQMFSDEVDKATSYEELKDIYNPSSPTSSSIPRSILMTPTLEMGARIVKLNTIATSPEFEGLIDKLPPVDQKFLKVAHLLSSPHDLQESYGDDWGFKRKDIYDGFCTMYKSYSDRVTTPEVKEILTESNPITIESFDDGGVINIFNNMVVTGIDPDDERTWTPEFEWMVNFRLFKKTQKIISSYINGSVGRESVYVVDKKSLSSGDHCVERKRPYERNIGDDESYILAAKWSPNTAETGRWRSAMHTVPWGSQVKKYYTSRFVGGTTLCPDYSQMEVRTLAAISKDENMLELFHSGKDFHTETAKKIWRKDEVTPAERRFSKTATFSLLYGAMEESFARNYCNGDMSMAKMIYGGFFEAYPRVQEWVQARHEEAQRDHRVSLELSNRFIQIPLEGEGRGALNSLLRKSQNYPIQAQSADLTGCVIFDLQQYIEENHMKSLVFQYVHDSIEVDVYPYEFIQLVDKLKVLLNESPMRRMGLPSKADVTLGKSLGHELDMKEITYNEDYTDCIISLEGFKDEVYETINNWKLAYNTVEIVEEEWKDKFISLNELFIVKKAYTPTVGTMRQEGHCKVHINYYR